MTQAVVVFDPGTPGAGSLGHVAWVYVPEQRSDGMWVVVVVRNYDNRGSTRTWAYRHGAGVHFIPAYSLWPDAGTGSASWT